MTNILTETRDNVRVIRLDRPEKRNALTGPMIEALLRALEAAAAEEGIAAILLAGNGAGFCAGADLAEMKALHDDPEWMAARRALSARLLEAPGRMGKPVAAAVHGKALGAGAALALACDATVLAEEATLGFPEARHGILPALMAPALLRHLPPRRALELLATGRDIPPGEALALGLATSVVPAASLEAAALAAARGMALLPPGDLLRLKRLCRGEDGA